MSRSRALVLSLAMCGACQGGDAPAKTPPSDAAPAAGKAPAAKEDPTAKEVAPADPAAAPTEPTTPEPASRRVSPQEAAAVTKQLAALGDGHPAAVVIRPAQWSAARAAIADLVGSKIPPELGALTGAKTPAEARAVVGKELLGVDLSALAGVDDARPWVAGLAEPPDPALQELPSIEEGAPKTRSLGLRHVVLVPVSDGKAFIESLPTALAPSIRPLPTWFEGTEPSFTGGGEDGIYVAATIEGDYARAVVFTETLGFSHEEAKAVLTPRLANDPAAPAQTPALGELTGRASLAAVHVRPWRLRELASFMGRNRLIPAVASAPADSRATMTAMGLTIVLTAEIMMLDEALEFDDWAWMFEADGSEARTLGVGSLTPHGAKIFDAAKTDVALLPAASKEAPALEGYVRLDVAKALAAVTPHRTMSTGRPSDAAESFQQCGPSCLQHAGLRTPIQMLATAAGWVPSKAGALPGVVAVQGILPSFDDLQGGVAIVGSTPNDAAAARTWLTGVVGGEIERTASPDEITRGSEGVLRLGIGAKPETLFGDGSRSVPSIAYARVQGKGQGSTPLGEAVERLVGVLQVDRRGRALVTQLVVAGGAEPAMNYAPAVTGTWPSPILSRADGTGAECVANAAQGIVKVFGAVATVDAASRQKVLKNGFDELAEEFACAGGSSDAKADALALRTLTDALQTWFAPVE